MSVDFTKHKQRLGRRDTLLSYQYTCIYQSKCLDLARDPFELGRLLTQKHGHTKLMVCLLKILFFGSDTRWIRLDMAQTRVKHGSDACWTRLDMA